MATALPEKKGVAAADKLEQILSYKEKGNSFFREKKYKEAARNYHKAILYVKAIEIGAKGTGLDGIINTKAEKMDEETLSRVREAKVAVYNNLSMCLMQQEEPKYDRALENLTIVLEADPDNVKANYRRGLALAKTGNHEGALEVFTKVKELEGGEKDYLKKAIALSEERVKEGRQRNKDMYKKMFA